MNNQQLYDSLIIKYVVPRVIACVILIIVLVVSLLYLHTTFKNRKKYVVKMTIGLLLCIGATVILGIDYTLDAIYDTGNDAYIKYEGVYVVNEYRSGRSGNQK